MGNWDVSKPDNDGERELIDRAVKALEAEFATKTCNKKITSKLEDAELARDYEETCNNKQVISKLVASEDCISRRAMLESIRNLYPDIPVMDIMGARRKWLKKYAPYFECENAVEHLPSVTQKQRTGHWIVLSPTDMYCSECNEIEHLDTSRKFCAYCGTRMSENPTGLESEEQA